MIVARFGRVARPVHVPAIRRAHALRTAPAARPDARALRTDRARGFAQASRRRRARASASARLTWKPSFRCVSALCSRVSASAAFAACGKCATRSACPRRSPVRRRCPPSLRRHGAPRVSRRAAQAVRTRCSRQPRSPPTSISAPVPIASAILSSRHARGDFGIFDREEPAEAAADLRLLELAQLATRPPTTAAAAARPSRPSRAATSRNRDTRRRHGTPPPRAVTPRTFTRNENSSCVFAASAPRALAPRRIVRRAVLDSARGSCRRTSPDGTTTKSYGSNAAMTLRASAAASLASPPLYAGWPQQLCDGTSTSQPACSSSFAAANPICGPEHIGKAGHEQRDPRRVRHCRGHEARRRRASPGRRPRMRLCGIAAPSA